MLRRLAVIALAAFATTAHAQTPKLADLLGFEVPLTPPRPGGWMPYPVTDAFSDESIVHGGRRSVRIERHADSARQFSGVTMMLPVDFEGKVLELRGFVRTENVTGFAALWMREDGAAQQNNLAFASLQGHNPPTGTSDWAEYRISVPVHPDAKSLYFGFLLNGPGKAWADDLQLLLDGKSLADQPPTPLETDHEFDAGSKITLTALSPVQIANLATLGRVWGFLKYHHPAIAGGRRHWDYDLFRVLPDVLKAPDRAAGNAALAKWIASLGDVPACTACARPPVFEVHLKPDTSWIASESELGPPLSRALQSIYANRPTRKQFYVSQVPGVSNPIFDNEPNYASVALPDSGYQLLALYRYWNIIQYWFPYRDVIGEDWSKVLPEYIPKLALAKSPDDYKRQMLTLIARVHDTHANLWSSLNVRPPVGRCQVPVATRFVEDRAVIVAHFDPEAPRQPQLRRGDVIDSIDGVPVADLVKQWEPYYAASNHPTALRDMGRSLTLGPCGEVKLGVVRGSEKLDLAAERVTATAPQTASTHDIPGDAFRMLSKDVAYIKISTLKRANIPLHIDTAAGTKGLVIDIRNYPGDFPLFELGGALVEKETPFVKFTRGDLTNPGAFVFDGASAALRPLKPHYAGKVVILVDEVSQSSAEYHTMAFRMAPNATVLGSTTAGADGNVSTIPLPGNLRSMISGIGVFYPDKRPTQRIGIVPDREVKPTIAGIRDGRDEVLEAALREILGPDAPEAEIRKLAMHN